MDNNLHPSVNWRFRQRLFRVYIRSWFFLLNHWASKYSPLMKADDLQKLSTQEKIREKNRLIQKKFHRRLLPLYHACRRCKDQCCNRSVPQNWYPPFCAVDYLLWGNFSKRHKNVHFSRINVWEVLKRGLPKTESAKPCPELADEGCLIPWGERPIYCVIWLCQDFLKLMTWGEYWHHLWLSSKYLFNVSLSQYKIISEWKRWGKMNNRIL